MRTNEDRLLHGEPTQYQLEAYQITTEDWITVEYDGELPRVIRAYTRGVLEPLYVGESIAAAATALELDEDLVSDALMSNPVIYDETGFQID